MVNENFVPHAGGVDDAMASVDFKRFLQPIKDTSFDRNEYLVLSEFTWRNSEE